MKTMKKMFTLLLALLMVVHAGVVFAEDDAPVYDAATMLAQGEEPVVLPLVEEPITLTWFAALDGKAAATRTSLSETDEFQEIARDTNITVEFVHPASSAFNERLNLMLASNQLTDLVSQGSWWTVPGGLDKLVEDGIILDLREPIKKWAPHIQAIFERHPELEQILTTANGYICYIPEMKETEEQHYTESLQIREDWLKKLNLEMPQTIDEWYTVLTAFKTQDPNGNGIADEIPIVAANATDNSFSMMGAAWGLNADLNQDDAMYVKDGQVLFAPVQPEFKEYVETMAKWYAEGLIDPDYLNVDSGSFSAKVLNDQAGVYFGNTNGHMGTFLSTKIPENPEFSLVAVHPPYAADGKSYDFTSFDVADDDGIAISANCKDIEAAMKLIDYLYSSKGILYSNYGVEGITYEMVDGKPQLIEDYVFNNPDGLSVAQVLAKHATTGISPKGLQLPDYWNLMRIWPQQYTIGEEGLKTTKERKMPPVKMTPDEISEYNSIMGEVKTYTDEMVNRFIIGEMSLDEYDDFVKTLESMGVSKAVQCKQAAYDRYVAIGK